MRILPNSTPKAQDADIANLGRSRVLVRIGEEARKPLAEEVESRRVRPLSISVHIAAMRADNRDRNVAVHEAAGVRRACHAPYLALSAESCVRRQRLSATHSLSASFLRHGVVKDLCFCLHMLIRTCLKESCGLMAVMRGSIVAYIGTTVNFPLLER